MFKKKKNSIEWLEFESLQPFPEVVHGVFWNVPLGEKTVENFPVALSALQLEKGVKLKQCHKDDVLLVDRKTPEHNENYDGMMTQEKGMGLLIRHADCQGTIFYDPKRRALAAVHCGWRGSVLNIYQKTIETMGETFGTEAKDLIVCIGPSLCPDHLEFKHFEEELPPAFWKFQVRPTYFNFWEISKEQLVKSGVPVEQIECANICTYEEGYSYRRDKKTFHHGTIAALSN